MQKSKNCIIAHLQTEHDAVIGDYCHVSTLPWLMEIAWWEKHFRQSIGYGQWNGNSKIALSVPAHWRENLGLAGIFKSSLKIKNDISM